MDHTTIYANNSYEPTPQTWPPFQPTAAQTARNRARHRFIFRVVYLPLGLSIVFILGLVGLMLWSSLFVTVDGRVANRAFLSGVADTIFICLTAPLLVIGGIIPLGIFITIDAGRRRGLAPFKALQRLFWRLDNILRQVDGRVNQITDRAVQPLTKARTRWAFGRALVQRLGRRLAARRDGIRHTIENLITEIEDRGYER